MPENTEAVPGEIKAPAPYRDIVSSYPQEMKDDCLQLSAKGYPPRAIRRALAQKYDKIPTSRTVRAWVNRDKKKIQEATPSHKEQEILAALEDEEEWVEDHADDILDYLAPELYRRLDAGELEKMYLKDLIDAVRKFLNDKAQRIEAKARRLNPQEGMTPYHQLIIQIQNNATKRTNGSSDSDEIPMQMGRISDNQLPAAPGTDTTS